ncbi:hypothetical protein BAUCODRAFT_132464 [Baudoinia panamericana UAMH 10762]|uniref:Uncharacterized protein n=1 Tax=Baudoinia panamericana (strain UAMH 10762) TaxID=717646 RepID=M2N736_BAUPA|nr:uncharacterized protein BAUCODRAFT_132464 [Baudoinia panamericana UAMH 10762]EMC94595.1 hypothetical protein BAUCODRAFT_132464 [Baudoinia panamericana UAMH 10762]
MRPLKRILGGLNALEDVASAPKSGLDHTSILPKGGWRRISLVEITACATLLQDDLIWRPLSSAVVVERNKPSNAYQILSHPVMKTVYENTFFTRLPKLRKAAYKYNDYAWDAPGSGSTSKHVCGARVSGAARPMARCLKWKRTIASTA